MEALDNSRGYSDLSIIVRFCTVINLSLNTYEKKGQSRFHKFRSSFWHKSRMKSEHLHPVVV